MSLDSLIDTLEKHGQMYVQPFEYDTLVAYLAGYDHAIVDAGGQSVLDEFRAWLHDRVGHHCSMNWSSVVRDLFAEGNKDTAVQKLFDLFKEFSGFKKGKQER